MKLYNKIMVKFWLIMSIVVFVLTTYKCIVDDYRQWVYYYVIALVALFMYYMKRWMIRRMLKHMAEMDSRAKNGQ
jgi:SNF family Na+-dependent transporter